MQQEDAKVQRFTFSKAERICSQNQITGLVDNRCKVFCYPFKCFYELRPASEGETLNRMLVCVPKRHFKHAVDRNRLKRLTREAYRLQHQKHLDAWTRPAGLQASLFFYYVADEILPYNFIESKIIEVMLRLRKTDLNGSACEKNH